MKSPRASVTRRVIAVAALVSTAAAGLTVAAPEVSAAAGSDILRAEETLRNEQFIRSSNGYSLVMQSDGNAVVYKPLAGGGRTPIWASNTPGRANAHLKMQSDGNLVLYASDGRPYWATGMKGAGSYLVMQADGNLVMYRPNSSGGRTPVWASNTAPSASSAPRPAPGSPAPGAAAGGPAPGAAAGVGQNRFTSGLTEPGCYRHGALWLSNDCSARDAWRKVKPMIDSGRYVDGTAAFSAILGPAAKKHSNLWAVASSSRYNPRCAAEAINAFLKVSVRIRQTVDGASKIIDAALALAKRGGAPGRIINALYSDALLRTALDRTAKVAGDRSARDAILQYGFCSA